MNSKDRKALRQRQMRGTSIPADWQPALDELIADDKIELGQSGHMSAEKAADLLNWYKRFPFFASIRTEAGIITSVGNHGWTCTCMQEQCEHMLIAQQSLERILHAYRLPTLTLSAQRWFKRRPRLEVLPGCLPACETDGTCNDRKADPGSKPTADGAISDSPGWSLHIDQAYSIVKARHGWPPGFPIFAAVCVTPDTLAWFGPSGWECSACGSDCAHTEVAAETAPECTIPAQRDVEFDEHVAGKLIRPPFFADEDDDNEEEPG